MPTWSWTSGIRGAGSIALLCASLSLCSRGALAGDLPAPSFADLYGRATAAYQAADYAAAIVHLSAAYELRPEARLLFNIAQSYRKLGAATQARDYYQRYLAVDKDIGPERAAEVRRFLAESEPAAVPDREPRQSPVPLPTIGVPSAPPPIQTVRVERKWPYALGGAAAAVGIGLSAAGIGFLAIHGGCANEVVAPALECRRVYDTKTPGTVQLVLGGAFLLAGTISTAVLLSRRGNTRTTHSLASLNRWEAAPAPSEGAR